MASEIIYRNIKELKLLDGNPRQITVSDMAKLKTSIKDNPEYFEARPLILSNRTGELVVIAGNQRLRACQELGITEVPTILLEGLTEEKEREIIIRDNVNNGSWDMDILANEWDLPKLTDWGVNLPTYSQEELDDFMEAVSIPKEEGGEGEKEKKHNFCPNCGYELG